MTTTILIIMILAGFFIKPTRKPTVIFANTITWLISLGAGAFYTYQLLVNGIELLKVTDLSYFFSVNVPWIVGLELLILLAINILSSTTPIRAILYSLCQISVSILMVFGVILYFLNILLRILIGSNTTNNN